MDQNVSTNTCHTVPYIYFTHPYTGKPFQIYKQSSKYYVQGPHEFTKYPVNGASEYSLFSSCNISLDRYSIPVSLAIWTK